MEIVVNLVCPQCGGSLLYEDELGHCILCASYWMMAGNMIVRTTPPLTAKDEARNLAENVEDIMAQAPGS